MKEPEMVKRRPVIVIKSSRYGPKELVQVACLSTATPEPQMAYHMLIDDKYLPRDKFFEGKETWLKGDMIYTQWVLSG